MNYLEKIKGLFVQFGVLLLVIVPLLKTNAQSCSFACASVNIGIDNSCSTTVTPSQVATVLDPDCTYNLTFQRPGDANALPQLTSADIGTSVMYTLSASDGTACIGTITVTFSGTGPSVFCPNGPIELPCNTDLSTYPAPIAFACNGVVNLIGQNAIEIQQADCDATHYSVVDVEYIYSDGINQTSCTVRYHLQAENPALVLPPADITLNCEPGIDISTLATGVPTYNGAVFVPSASCNLMISNPSDSRTAGCGNTEEITRTWSLMDMCSGSLTTISQSIVIQDITQPAIVLPQSSLTVDALPSICSSGMIDLPVALISDQCSDFDQLTVSTTVPGQGVLAQNGGSIAGLPVGSHQIIYTVTDDCLLSTTSVLTLQVEDVSAPNVICRTHQVASLSNLGIASMPAMAFDNGSTDNCNPVFFKVRRMLPSSCDLTPQFNDQVTFCCEDVNDPVVIILRVYDVNPGNGPISADAFQGRYNECMVNVEVQDKLMPTVVCPSSAIVNCDFDLDFYLTNDIPVATDNCNNNIDVTVAIDRSGLNECGVGLAIRTINYTDGENELVCSQNITVENSAPNGGIEIVWPTNTMISGCGGDVSPDSLPVGSQRPIVTVNGCANIAMRSDDMVFDIVEDACFKVIRTWEVIDWCTFDLESGTGVYRHHQLIKVLDDEAPILSGLDAISMEIGVEDDCGVQQANVVISPISAVDCTPEHLLRFRYRIDFGNNGTYDTGFLDGANASGQFPSGTSRIQYRVEDRCGNFSTGERLVEISIRDLKKPTPVLKNLTTALMPGMQMVTIQARMFNADSYDNCSFPQNLRYSFSDQIEDEQRIFTCDHIDTQFVTIYVWDEAGNVDFADVWIVIADNNGDCPENVGGRTFITGKIINERNEEIESVKIELLRSDKEPVMTNLEGSFRFENVRKHRSYDICPTKDVNPRNGVTVIDLIKIQRHILGIERLDSPYKMIAADANRSGGISGADLVAIQRVILGFSDKFDGRPSWRFLDADFEFVDPLNPFSEPLPEMYTIPQLEQQIDKRFVGIKIGDVDNTARLRSSLMETYSRNKSKIDLYVSDVWVNQGEIIELKVYAKQDMQVQGIQGSINIIQEKAQLINLIGHNLTGFNKDLVNDWKIMDGELSFLWYDGKGVKIEQGTSIYSIKMHAKESGYVSDLFSGANETLESIMVVDGKPMTWSIQFEKEPAHDMVKLLHSKPNPFDTETVLSFYLKYPTQVTISITDMAGRVMYQRSGQFEAGTTDISIHKNILGGSGVYLYRLDAPGFSETRRMVLVSN